MLSGDEGKLLLFTIRKTIGFAKIGGDHIYGRQGDRVGRRVLDCCFSRRYVSDAFLTSVIRHERIGVTVAKLVLGLQPVNHLHMLQVLVLP